MTQTLREKLIEKVTRQLYEDRPRSVGVSLQINLKTFDEIGEISQGYWRKKAIRILDIPELKDAIEVKEINDKLRNPKFQERWKREYEGDGKSSQCPSVAKGDSLDYDLQDDFEVKRGK